MAEIKKARIFLRRGTDASRLGTELCEAELGYSTDGTRVFVGDGSTLGGNSLGTTVFLLPTASAVNPTSDPFSVVSTLTAVSADGRAEIGDMAFVPASTYNVSSFNAHVSGDSSLNVTSTPASTFGTLYVLSARDGGTGSLTWTVANSGIPVSHLDIPDNSIAGDKIHGGDISGELTFSDHVTSLSSVTLSGVAKAAQDPTLLTGDVIYPLGITATSEVTAVSSIYRLGINNSSFLPCSAAGQDLELNWNGTVIEDTGIYSKPASVGIGTTTINTGNFNDYNGWGPSDVDDPASQLAAEYRKITVNITAVHAMIGRTDIAWSDIGDFICQWHGVNAETDAGFFGYKNAALNTNVVLMWDLRSTNKGRMDSRNYGGLIYIPNSYTTSDQTLELHLGGRDATSAFKMLGIRLR